MRSIERIRCRLGESSLLSLFLNVTLYIGLAAGLSLAMNAHAKKKTFIYCSEGSPSNFNPQIATDGTSYNASGTAVFDQLVAYEYGTTNLRPGLAESWEVSKNGLYYTFKLRKGVKFHSNKLFTPTRDFNADDVLFSFNRMLKESHPYHKVGGGTYEYFESLGTPKLVKDLVKVDDYTIKFVLNKPEAPFLASMAMHHTSIHSKEYADKLASLGKQQEIDLSPIGTGPFVFKKYVRDSVIRYVHNKEYWRGAPKIENLIYSITPDPSVRYQKLKTGECNFVTFPAPSDLKDMEANPKIKVMSQEGMNVAYLAMNVQKKPFNDVRVRKAINLALNRQSYIDAIYLGKGAVAKNPIPPTLWGYHKGLTPFSVNIEEAKKLLAKAGLPNGFETELWTLPVSRPYNPNGKKMGEMMQADLAKIGVKVKLVSFDWPTYLAKTRKGEHAMAQLGWSADYADPDNFLFVLLGCQSVETGSNIAKFCDSEFDRIVTKAKRLTDVKERTKLYMRAQKVFQKKVPWATIAHSVVYKAMSSNVSGYKIDPLAFDYFDEVDIQ